MECFFALFFFAVLGLLLFMLKKILDIENRLKEMERVHAAVESPPEGDGLPPGALSASAKKKSQE